jgi:hypothetical protein
MLTWGRLLAMENVIYKQKEVSRHLHPRVPGAPREESGGVCAPSAPLPHLRPSTHQRMMLSLEAQ